MTEFSLAPDSRSIQTIYYHFDDKTSGTSGGEGLTFYDSLAIALNKIYDDNFSDLSKDLKNILIDILISNVSLEHKNLKLLAIANYIVYNLRINSMRMTPDIFNQYFQYFLPKLMSDITETKTLDKNKLSINLQASLYRYIKHIQENIPEFAKQK